MRPSPTAARVYQPQLVRDIVGPGRHGGPAVPEEDPAQDEGAGERPEGDAQCGPEHGRSLRHTYNLVDLPIKVAGKSGTAEFGTRDSKGRLPFHSWFVGFVPKDLRHGSFDDTDSQLIVLAFAYDSRTKGNVGDRDREVLPAAPLRDQEGLPAPGPPQARQLLPEQLMGVIRAEPARVTDWAAKSVGAAWRAFDLQLATYAGLLVAIGLVMAYTNSVEAGTVPLEAGTTFSRGLMWAAIAVVVFIVATVVRLSLAQDAGLADLRPPARPAGPDARDRRAASADRLAGSRSGR